MITLFYFYVITHMIVNVCDTVTRSIHIDILLFQKIVRQTMTDVTKSRRPRKMFFFFSIFEQIKLVRCAIYKQPFAKNVIPDTDVFRVKRIQIYRLISNRIAGRTEEMRTERGRAFCVSARLYTKLFRRAGQTTENSVTGRRISLCYMYGTDTITQVC